MERKLANEKFKWNLSDIYKSQDELLADFEKLEKNCEKFAVFQGKLGEFNVILEYFHFIDEFECMLEKVNSYILLSHDMDTNNSKIHQLNERLNILLSNVAIKTAFINPELASLPDDYYEKLLNDKRFTNYDYIIKDIRSSRKHILSTKEEAALSIISKFSNGFTEVYECLTQNDFKFEPVIINGKAEVLTQSTYSRFLENSDPNIRKQAYNNLYDVFNQFSKSIAFNYINFAKMVNSDTALRCHSSTFNQIFQSEKIPEELFKKLIDNVNKNVNLEQKYFQMIKSVLNLPVFGFQDIYQPLSNNHSKKWSVDEQKEIVLQALSILGDDYTTILLTAFNENWIDFFPDINKKSGGYMLGVYGVHPYILLNDNGGYDSISTLAHELGHAMHTYYSNTKQPYSKHNYATFIAEIASTVNEIILNKYLLSNAKTDEEKLFYLSHYLQNFKGTVFRQTMFSEFEDFVYKNIEANKPLSPDILDEKYKELLQNHFGDVVKMDNNIIHEWTRIPHFYSPYYVYQYATSYISAVYIASKIINGDNTMLCKYKEMLSSGCNGYPTDILQKAGVNLMDDATYEYAFNDFKQSLEYAKILLKTN